MLFACRYYQAKDHWQIARRFESGFTRFGKVEAVPAAKVPPAVKKVALQGAALIGKGLYGVDIKELNGHPVIIEINDNPNIDTGYEDTVEKDRIYEKIITCFLRRVRVESELALKPEPAKTS
jgi:glutathione synthase/RimK-type ligase-like ATP-grasp enzyme